MEDHNKRLLPFGDHVLPFGDHAGCRTAQNGKLEDWVSGPSVPERTFQLSGFDHSLLGLGLELSVLGKLLRSVDAGHMFKDSGQKAADALASINMIKEDFWV